MEEIMAFRYALAGACYVPVSPHDASGEPGGSTGWEEHS
jgi:hypothetical protein